VTFPSPPAPSSPGLGAQQHKIGGDPVERLAGAMPRTNSAAHRVRRAVSAPDTRRNAADLLQALAAVECDFAVGGLAGVPAGLLRDVVIITTRLVGRGWLESNADRADAFTALYGTRLPPPLAELDRILADVLSSRFGVPRATAHPGARPRKYDPWASCGEGTIRPLADPNCAVCGPTARSRNPASFRLGPSRHFDPTAVAAHGPGTKGIRVRDDGPPNTASQAGSADADARPQSWSGS